MSERRIVITGMGLATPFGYSLDDNWNALIDGKSCIKKIDNFNVADLPCKIGGQVQNFNEYPFLEDAIRPQDIRKMDRFIALGIIAAYEALRDSGLLNKFKDNEVLAKRSGVIVSSGIGGLELISENTLKLEQIGFKKISPYFIPASIINLMSSWISINHGLRGLNYAIVNACSSSAYAISEAARAIKSNDVDVVLAGGSEAATCRVGMAGFAALRALATKYNDDPTCISPMG